MEKKTPIIIFKVLFILSIMVQGYFLYTATNTTKRGPAGLSYLGGKLEFRTEELHFKTRKMFSEVELFVDCDWIQTKKIFHDGTYGKDHSKKKSQMFPISLSHNVELGEISGSGATQFARGPSFFNGDIQCSLRIMSAQTIAMGLKYYQADSQELPEITSCGLSGCFRRPDFSRIDQEINHLLKKQF